MPVYRIAPSGASAAAVIVAATGGTYTTLSAAIAAGATDIELKAGTYDGGQTIPAGTRIRGAGMTKTILLAPVGADGLTLGADVLLEDVAVDGRRTLQPVVQGDSYSGIVVAGDNVTLSRVWVFGPRNHGVLAKVRKNLRVLNCRIENIHTSTAVAGWSYYGIFLQDCDRPVVRETLITGFAQALGLWYGTRDAVIENNDFINNYGYLDDAHTLTRSACEDFGASTAIHARNDWVNNRVDGSTSCCFEIAQGVKGSRFIGNITKNPGTGMGHFEVVGETGQITTDVIIQGNRIIGDPATTVNSGVKISALVYRTQIVGNIFSGFVGTGQAAVFVGGTGTTGEVRIADNIFNACFNSIWLNSNGDGVQITGNRVTGGTGAGVTCYSGNRHVITGNTIASAAAIECRTAANTITNNVIEAGALVGIRLQNATATDNIVDGNVVTSTTGWGIIVENGLRNTVKNNRTYGPTFCVRVVGAGKNIVDRNYALGDLGISADAGNYVGITHTAAQTYATARVSIGSKTVGTTPLTVPHGLGYAPTEVTLTMTGPGAVYRSAASDATNIYLTADATGRTCDVFVR